jgi:3-hydroxyisobutyrate dehydrogenase-like beta-hydroxyacid dehydrogenase
VPSLLVDCTTVDPISADKLSAAASRASLHKASRPFPGLPKDRPTLVDAPVSGGAHVARAGQLSFMVGGDKAALAAVEPFLHDISKHGHITYCGRHGAASAAKLCNTVRALSR